MSLLGLISCPVLAASDQDQTQTYKHHHRIKHHHEENYKGEEAIEAVGYKGEVAAPTCPKVSIYNPILDAMSQNVGRAKPTVDCDKPIQFAGGINFDTQWGNLGEGFMGENNTRFTLNDAYLNATGQVNDWVSAFLEVSYNNIQDTTLNGANFNRYPTITKEPLPGLYSAGYTLDALDLQQGYIMLGNPEKFPLFLKLGKQFLDYGRYTIHPITRSMTQVMTETLQTSAELSFISMWNDFDFHGSFFTFQNQITEVDEGDLDIDSTGRVIDVKDSAGNNGKTNYGIQLGVGRVSNQLGFDVGIGYMYNIFGVNDIAYATAVFKGGTNASGRPIDVDQSLYVDRVAGLTAYGMVNSGPFSLSAHYATALQDFDSIDLTFEGDDAQPWAFDITAAYGFNYWDRAQNLYVGYQQSGEAANLFVPHYRWIAGYGIDVLKNTNVGLEYSYDKAYDDDEDQDGETTNRVALRVAVKFG
jgi:hypothetical protein